MPSPIEAVRAANAAFYQAFRRRDAARMASVWTRREELALCIHPGWGVLRGRAPIMESWRRILGNPDSPVVDCSDVEVAILGTSAIVTCREGVVGGPASLVATNVFVEEDGEWRMVHHHAGPVAPASIPAPPDRTLN